MNRVAVITLALLTLLVAVPALGASAIVSWDAVTEDINDQPEVITGYYVGYGNSSGTYSSGHSTGPVTEFQVDDLTPGQTYYFAVRATDQGFNTSAWSSEVVFTIPGDSDGGTTTDGGGQDDGGGGGDEAGTDAGGGTDTGGSDIAGGCSCSIPAVNCNALWLALLSLPLIRRRRRS